MEAKVREVLRRAIEEDAEGEEEQEDGEEGGEERSGRDPEDDRAALKRLEEEWFEVEVVLEDERRLGRVRVIDAPKKSKSKKNKKKM